MRRVSFILLTFIVLLLAFLAFRLNLGDDQAEGQITQVATMAPVEQSEETVVEEQSTETTNDDSLTVDQLANTEGEQSANEQATDQSDVEEVLVNQQSEPEPITALSTGLTPEDIYINIEGFANSVQGTVNPPQQMAWEAPANILLSFEREAKEEPWPDAPYILIFSVDEHRAESEAKGLYKRPDEIDQLQALLSDSPPAIASELPVLPDQHAAQVMAIKLKQLPFQNGTGLRFITYYVQNGYPPLNGHIMYTYQGLSADGQHYISAWYPLSAVGLPNTYEESGLPTDHDEFVAVFPAYMEETIKMLSDLEADQYTPSLNQLDAMIQSLRVGGE